MDSLDSAEILNREQVTTSKSAAVATVEHDTTLTIRYKRRGNGLFMNMVLVPIALYSTFELLRFAFP